MHQQVAGVGAVVQPHGLAAAGAGDDQVRCPAFTGDDLPRQGGGAAPFGTGVDGPCDIAEAALGDLQVFLNGLGLGNHQRAVDVGIARGEAVDVEGLGADADKDAAQLVGEVGREA